MLLLLFSIRVQWSFWTLKLLTICFAVFVVLHLYLRCFNRVILIAFFTSFLPSLQSISHAKHPVTGSAYWLNWQLSSLLADLATNPSAEILDALRGLERKTSTVFTLLKASVYSIVLQQEIRDDNQDEQGTETPERRGYWVMGHLTGYVTHRSGKHRCWSWRSWSFRGVGGYTRSLLGSDFECTVDIASSWEAY